MADGYIGHGPPGAITTETKGFPGLVQQRIYLDHAAMSPMRPEAIAAVTEGMQRWANPSSPHAEGRAARATLERAREAIKTAFDWPHALLFTSGASEALRIALTRAKGGRRWRSPVEHDAVLRAAPEAGVLRLTQEQDLDPASLDEALAAGDRPVIAVQQINSETGRDQFPYLLDSRIAKAGGMLVCDAAQAAGRVKLLPADMIALSAHKFGGPPGIGALLVRDLGLLEPSGGQEFGYRPGTENLPAILGFAAAAQAASAAIGRIDPLLDAKRALLRTLRAEGGRTVGGHGMFAGHILAIAMPHLSARAQLMRLDATGFAVSAGSACSSGSLKPSRVLAAYGVPADEAERTIRISFGWSTTPQEVEAFTAAWRDLAREARARAA